jgi:hypothetical protein
MNISSQIAPTILLQKLALVTGSGQGKRKAIDCACSSELGLETMPHADTLIGEITTFLVEPYVVI